MTRRQQQLLVLFSLGAYLIRLLRLVVSALGERRYWDAALHYLYLVLVSRLADRLLAMLRASGDE